jgi:5,10-methylenetetrahydromethanopterin reductase
MEVWMHTFAFPRRVAEMARRAEAWWPAVELEQALVAVQGFLRGEEVPIDGVRSRIGWVAEDGFPKVPVVVAATGPRVIAAAARNAERIVFTVAQSRTACVGRWRRRGPPPRTTGLPSAPTSMWRCIPIDVSLGSWSGEAQRSSLATEGAPPDGLSDVTRAGIEQLASGYDATRHGHSSATHAQQLEDDFIDRFAVTGPAKEVGERLAALAALGLERIVVVPGSLDADPANLAESNARFAADVLPELRGL